MKFTIEAENIEELILAAQSLLNCTAGKAGSAETVKPAKASKAKKAEAPKAEKPAETTTEAESSEPETPPVEEVPVEEAPVEEAPKPEEPKAEEDKSYALEDIRNKVKEYTRSGRKDEMRDILKSFGATRSTDLAEADYAAFMEKCNG